MKYIPAIIAILIYAFFTYLSYVGKMEESYWQVALFGSLFIAGIASGLFSTSKSKHSIILAGKLVVGSYIAVYIWSDPLFIIGAIFLLVCHASFYYGWQLGLNGIK